MVKILLIVLRVQIAGGQVMPQLIYLSTVAGFSKTSCFTSTTSMYAEKSHVGILRRWERTNEVTEQLPGSATSVRHCTCGGSYPIHVTELAEDHNFGN